MPVEAMISGVVGLLFGGAVVWFVMRTRAGASQAVLQERLEQATNDKSRLGDELGELEAVVNKLRDEGTELQKQLAERGAKLEAEQKLTDELKQASEELKTAFKALSAEALERNQKSFLEVAKTSLEKYQEGAKSELEKRSKAIDQLVKPLTETLGHLDKKVGEIEKHRVGAYSELREQITNMGQVQDLLRKETANLVTALRKPTVRGRWGEFQLRNVAEMAGMTQFCDFTEQTTTDSDEGRFRPDMVVNLPNDKKIVVDSKVPLDAYLEAIEAEDEDVRKARLQHHARQVRDHIKKLSQKSYWSQFEESPEFVVMFLPGETIFYAALEQDPKLIEEGISEKVILATPTTLIALLKAVAYGWKEEALADNAREISELGKLLYDRIRKVATDVGQVGRSLNAAVKHYNAAVGSIESRLLVTARKFKELGATDDKELSSPEQVEISPRELSADDVPKLLDGDREAS